MSTDTLQPSVDDRRSAARFPMTGPVDVAELDHDSLPARTVGGTEMVNISAGGMAFLSNTQVQTGAKIMAMIGAGPDTGDPAGKLFLEILECSPRHDGRFLVRCRLMGGAMSAKLIFDRGNGRFLV